MDKYEDVFNEGFKFIGGRLYPIPDYLDFTLDFHRKNFNHRINTAKKNIDATLNDIYFDYLNNGCCNAVAYECNKIGYIGLNWGNIIILADIFNRMLSHPEIFPSINASEESFPPSYSYGVTMNATELLKLRFGDSVPNAQQIWNNLPKNKLRENISELCRRIVLDFIIFHEIAHIINGHTEYLQTKFSAPFMLEFDSSAHPANNSILRQSLEMNADAFATSSSLSLFFSEREALVKKIPHLEIIMDNHWAAAIWAFAVSSFFYVSPLSYNIETITSMAHLPPSIRMEGNLKLGLRLAEDTGLLKLKKGEQFNLGCVIDAFQKIGFSYPEEEYAQYTKFRNDERVISHVDTVVRMFDFEIKQELQQGYTHHNLDEEKFFY